MNPLDEALKSWEAFYLAVATAAATLMGLLFVALSVNLALLRGPDGQHHRDTAVRTFGDFVFVLLLSLIVLVPNQQPAGFAIALLVLGTFRMVSLARQALNARQHGRRKPGAALIVRDYALPFIASAGLIAETVQVLLGHFGWVVLLSDVVFALLVTACWNAWSLLLQQVRAG